MASITNETSETKIARLTLANEIEQLGDYCKTLELPDVCYDRNKHLILRIDGHKFSSFTQGFGFNNNYIRTAMQFTAIELLNKFNAYLAYTQSDEITLLIHKPGEKSNYDFNGRRQKLESLVASYASARFNWKLQSMVEDPMDRVYFYDTEGKYENNQPLHIKKMLGGQAHFDCRGIQPNEDSDIVKVFRWRQLDAFRNGVSSFARSLPNSKLYDKMNTGQKIEVIKSSSIVSFCKPTSDLIHGVWIKNYQYESELTHPKTGELIKAKRSSPTIDESKLSLKYPSDFVTMETPLAEWMLSKYVPYPIVTDDFSPVCSG